MKRADRKTKIEAVVKQCVGQTGRKAEGAWIRLTIALLSMAEPEARPPRFNGLLRAIWHAATNEDTPL